MPSVSQLPMICTPGLSAATERNRRRSSPGTTQVRLYAAAAPASDAKILRPETRKPPSTGVARVITPAVAPFAMPSDNGCAWIAPSSTIEAYSVARIASCRVRSSSVIVRSSAITPVQSTVCVCMFSVSAVIGQYRASAAPMCM